MEQNNEGATWYPQKVKTELENSYENYKGATRSLENFHELLLKNNIIAVTAPAGAGKTVFVKQYLNSPIAEKVYVDHAISKYRIVWFGIDAIDQLSEAFILQALKKSYRYIFKDELGGYDLSNVLEAYLNKIEEVNKPNLSVIVFDNVDNEKILEKIANIFNKRDYPYQNLKVVITTKIEEIEGLFRHTLDLLTKDESKAFVEKLLSKGSNQVKLDKAVVELLKKINRNPKTLELLACYIRRNGKENLPRVNTNKKVNNNSSGSENQYNLIFSQILKNSLDVDKPSVQHLLVLIARSHPDRITLNSLTVVKQSVDVKQFVETLIALRIFKPVHDNAEGFYIHRLDQDAISEFLKRQITQDLPSKENELVTNLAKRFDYLSGKEKDNEQLFLLVRNMIFTFWQDENFAKENHFSRLLINFCLYCIFTLRERSFKDGINLKSVVETVSKKIVDMKQKIYLQVLFNYICYFDDNFVPFKNGFEDRFASIANNDEKSFFQTLYYEIQGNMFYRQEKYQKAIDIYSQALTILNNIKQKSKNVILRKAIIEQNIGCMKYYLGSTAEGLSSLEDSEKSFREVFGVEELTINASYAITLHSIGRVKLTLQELGQAEKYLNQAFIIHEKNHPTNLAHEDCAYTLTAKGDLYLAQSNLDEAGKCLNRAYEIYYSKNKAEEKYPFYMEECCLSYAVYWSKKQNIKKTRFFLQEAEKILKANFKNDEITEGKYKFGFLNKTKGIVYLNLGMLEKALIFFGKGEKYFKDFSGNDEKNHHEHQIIEAYINRVHLLQGNFNKSINRRNSPEILRLYAANELNLHERIITLKESFIKSCFYRVKDLAKDEFVKLVDLFPYDKFLIDKLELKQSELIEPVQFIEQIKKMGEFGFSIGLSFLFTCFKDNASIDGLIVNIGIASVFQAFIDEYTPQSSEFESRNIYSLKQLYKLISIFYELSYLEIRLMNYENALNLIQITDNWLKYYNRQFQEQFDVKDKRDESIKVIFDKYETKLLELKADKKNALGWLDIAKGEVTATTVIDLKASFEFYQTSRGINDPDSIIVAYNCANSLLYFDQSSKIEGRFILEKVNKHYETISSNGLEASEWHKWSQVKVLLALSFFESNQSEPYVEQMLKGGLECLWQAKFSFGTFYLIYNYQLLAAFYLNCGQLDKAKENIRQLDEYWQTKIKTNVKLFSSMKINEIEETTAILKFILNNPGDEFVRQKFNEQFTSVRKNLKRLLTWLKLNKQIEINLFGVVSNIVIKENNNFHSKTLSEVDSREIDTLLSLLKEKDCLVLYGAQGGGKRDIAYATARKYYVTLKKKKTFIWSFLVEDIYSFLGSIQEVAASIGFGIFGSFIDNNNINQIIKKTLECLLAHIKETQYFDEILFVFANVDKDLNCLITEIISIVRSSELKIKIILTTEKKVKISDSISKKLTDKKHAGKNRKIKIADGEFDGTLSNIHLSGLYANFSERIKSKKSVVKLDQDEAIIDAIVACQTKRARSLLKCLCLINFNNITGSLFEYLCKSYGLKQNEIKDLEKFFILSTATDESNKRSYRMYAKISWVILKSKIIPEKIKWLTDVLSRIISDGILYFDLYGMISHIENLSQHVSPETRYMLWHKLGLAYEKNGYYLLAKICFDKVSYIFERNGQLKDNNQPYLDSLLFNCKTLILSNELKHAADRLDRALIKLKNEEMRARIGIMLTDVCIRQNHLDRAKISLSKIDTTVNRLNNNKLRNFYFLMQGYLCFHEGKLDDALSLFISMDSQELVAEKNIALAICHYAKFYKNKKNEKNLLDCIQACLERAYQFMNTDDLLNVELLTLYDQYRALVLVEKGPLSDKTFEILDHAIGRVNKHFAKSHIRLIELLSNKIYLCWYKLAISLELSNDERCTVMKKISVSVDSIRALTKKENEKFGQLISNLSNLINSPQETSILNIAKIKEVSQAYFSLSKKIHLLLLADNSQHPIYILESKKEEFILSRFDNLILSITKYENNKEINIKKSQQEQTAEVIEHSGTHLESTDAVNRFTTAMPTNSSSSVAALTKLGVIGTQNPPPIAESIDIQDSASVKVNSSISGHHVKTTPKALNQLYQYSPELLKTIVYPAVPTSLTGAVSAGEVISKTTAKNQSKLTVQESFSTSSVELLPDNESSPRKPNKSM